LVVGGKMKISKESIQEIADTEAIDSVIYWFMSEGKSINQIIMGFALQEYTALNYYTKSMVQYRNILTLLV
jgi:hypothetical protein